MIQPKNSIVVLELGENRIVASSNNEHFDNLIYSKGFSKTGENFIKENISELDMIDDINFLIKIDALFSGGNGWSPSEVVEHYRDLNKVSGTYKRIVWKNPEDYIVSNE